MPTYEYQCDGCGHKFDLFQSIKADPIRKCPSCRKLKVRRLISGGGGLIFKGSGFYITDYRSEGYRKSASSDTAASSSASSGSGSSDSAGKPSTDSKPASKPAGKSKAAE